MTFNQSKLQELQCSFPLMSSLMKAKDIVWINPDAGKPHDPVLPFGAQEICDASDRLQRFAPYIQKSFPETAASGGIIESSLLDIPSLHNALARQYALPIPGRLMLKCDNALPVSGSIKARGGIHEVLKFAESIALEKKMLTLSDDYAVFCDERFQKTFSAYRISVGSTGNLGLSIGIISAKLGFHVTVHMSADAREWKKDLLRSKGVTVVEYPDDYEEAVAEGRRQAAQDPMCHFVDDEASPDLFFGYAVAAERLAGQLTQKGVVVDGDHPLFVYLPCGVGGGPGGVAFGLHQIFGQNVHCFFAEPTHAPCMLLGMMTGLHDQIAVGDIGLSGKTAADGLAVGRPSRLVGSLMQPILDGCFTVQDEELYRLLALLADEEGIYLEPSACAGIPGIRHILSASDYLKERILSGSDMNTSWDKMSHATHLFWATGGGMVPDQDMQAYYQKGKKLLLASQ